MLTGIFVDSSDLADVRRGIEELHRWEAALDGDDTETESLRQLLNLDTARLVRLAHEHFGTGRFNLHQLAAASGENLRVLHGMTGSLGRACESRHTEVFDRHGGSPLVLSLRQEVANLIEAEAN